MISVENVTKTIKKKDVLKDVTLDFREGESYLLSGHNGCGKTMLLRLLCGFIKPTHGERIEERPYRYGVIIETPTFFMQETAFQNLKYLASINKRISDREINAWLKRLRLYRQKDKKVKTFSLGMRQRLALCQAFMEDPDVLLLDEPFNAIDDENIEIACELIEEARDRGKIVVVASHGHLDFIRFDNVIHMSDGRVKEVLA